MCVCAVAQTTPLLPFARKREHARSSSANMVKITIKFYALLRLLLYIYIYGCMHARARPIYHTCAPPLFRARNLSHAIKNYCLAKHPTARKLGLLISHESQRHVSDSVRINRKKYTPARPRCSIWLHIAAGVQFGASSAALPLFR
jgi:hypothetical protein